jgi:hypothetical protein
MAEAKTTTNHDEIRREGESRFNKLVDRDGSS